MCDINDIAPCTPHMHPAMCLYPLPCLWPSSPNQLPRSVATQESAHSHSRRSFLHTKQMTLFTSEMVLGLPPTQECRGRTQVECCGLRVGSCGNYWVLFDWLDFCDGGGGGGVSKRPLHISKKTYLYQSHLSLYPCTCV